MAVTAKDVEHIAQLARLALNEDEISAYTEEMNQILGYVEKLNELDTASVEPLSHPVEMSNVFREDELKPSVSTEEALRNAPQRTDAHFTVPKVITGSHGQS